MSRSIPNRDDPGRSTHESGLETFRANPDVRGPVQSLDGRESIDHLAFIYETREEQFATVVPYIRQGLERGEQCLYIASDNSREDVLSALRAGGIDVDSALESGALSVRAVDETYMEGGAFDPDDGLALLEDAIEDANAEFEGFRVTAEETWLLERDTEIAEFMTMEACANDVFCGDGCLALCQYNREQFPPEAIEEVIRTHPYLVHENTVCRNVYYRPPDEYFGPDRPEREVDRKLRTLTERTEARVALEDRTRALQAQNEIIADSDRSFEEKLRALFELGRDRFDLELGAMARVDADADRFEVEYVSGDHEHFEPGLELPLSETYCAVTAEAGTAASVTDPAEAGLDGTVVVEEYGLRTYLGTYVEVEGGPDRTFFFVSSEPRERPFSEDDRTLQELMGKWAGYELERRRRERDLEEYREYTDDLLDAIDDVFYVVDEDGYFRRWNETTTEVTGYPDEEFESMHALEFFEDDDVVTVADGIREVFETGSARVEAELLTADGDSIPYEFAASALENPDGDRVLVGIGRDITERRERERALEERERRLSALIDNVPGMVYRCRNERGWPVEFASDACRDLTGYASEALERGEVEWGEDIIVSEDRDDVWEAFRVNMTEGEPFSTTYRIETADGEVRWVRDYGRGVYDEDGDLVEIKGIVSDITERKRRTREHQRVVQALETAEEGVSLLDEEGEFIYVNEAYADIFGYEPEEMLGEHWEALGIEEDPEYVHEEVLPAVERDGQWTGTTTCVRSDDSRFLAQHSLTQTGDDELICVLRDVTERRRLEAELEEVLGRVTDAFYALDEEWRFTHVNERARELIDYTGEGLVGENMWEVFEWAADSELREAYERAMETQEPTSVELYYPEPLEAWYEVNAYPSETGLSVYFRDVTERKEREQDLELFRNLIDRSNDAVLVEDPETGRFLDVNETACRRLGYSREELLDLSVPDIEVELPDQRAWQSFVADLREEGVTNFEGEHRRKDGSTFPVEVNVVPVELDEEYLLAIARDVTEREERERYLRELYEITADGDRSFEEKLDRLLDLGRERFGLDAGFLLERDGEEFRVVKARGADFEEGVATVWAEPDQYCEKAVMQDGPLGVEDTGAAGWDDHPLYREHSLRCYLGTKLTDGAGVYGTVCFADGDTREEEFTDAEHTFLELMGQWVSQELQQERHERRLAALAEMSRDLMGVKTREDLAETAIGHADAGMQLPVAALVYYDDETGDLDLAARTPQAEDVLPIQALCARGDGRAWEAFVEGEAQIIEDVSAIDGASDRFTAAAALPLGHDGVFITATATCGGIGPTELDFLETTAATIKAACARLDREHQLQEREEALEAQNETLERLNRVNTIIRTIDQGLVEASTRESVERVVCENLAESGPYELAWIGESDPVTDEVLPREWAGGERGYLDEVTVSADGDRPAGRGPVGRAIRTHEPQVVNDVLQDRDFEPWRQAALNRGYHACLALPLVYQDTVYGVLAVYADRPGVFDELERAVLAELSDNVAYAINAVESKKALVSDEITELEFSVTDSELDLVELVRETGCELTVESLVPRADGELRAFASMRGAAADEVLAFASRMDVDDITLIAEHDEDDEPVCLFELTLGEASLGKTVLEHGGRTAEVSVIEGTATVVVHLAADADVRGFVEMFQSKYADSEVVAKRTRERPTRTTTGFRAELIDELTPRQLEALQTAYFSGYFQQPRTRSAREIAETMDISQPTFNSHLRSAQRKVCHQLFEEYPVST